MSKPPAEASMIEQADEGMRRKVGVEGGERMGRAGLEAIQLGDVDVSPCVTAGEQRVPQVWRLGGERGIRRSDVLRIELRALFIAPPAPAAGSASKQAFARNVLPPGLPFRSGPRSFDLVGLALGALIHKFRLKPSTSAGAVRGVQTAKPQPAPVHGWRWRRMWQTRGPRQGFGD